MSKVNDPLKYNYLYSELAIKITPPKTKSILLQTFSRCAAIINTLLFALKTLTATGRRTCYSRPKICQSEESESEKQSTQHNKFTTQFNHIFHLSSIYLSEIKVWDWQLSAIFVEKCLPTGFYKFLVLLSFQLALEMERMRSKTFFSSSSYNFPNQAFVTSPFSLIKSIVGVPPTPIAEGLAWNVSLTEILFACR